MNENMNWCRFLSMQIEHTYQNKTIFLFVLFFYLPKKNSIVTFTILHSNCKIDLCRFVIHKIMMFQKVLQFWKTIFSIIVKQTSVKVIGCVPYSHIIYILDYYKLLFLLLSLHVF
jgi:hypothetical protein